MYVVAILPEGEEEPSSPIKIGICDDPLSRLGNLQVGNFFELVMHQHWWLVGKPVAVLVESAFKEKYKESNIRGEWFDMEPDEAVRKAARELSEIGPRFHTETTLVEEMRKSAERAAEGYNFIGWIEQSV